MWRRRRVPHPDPATELALLRILDLRASVDRRAGLTGQYRREIEKLYGAARAETSSKRIELYNGEAAALHDRILAVEAGIAATGDEIAALQQRIEPADLAFL
jgi:hypothetical protein